MTDRWLVELADNLKQRDIDAQRRRLVIAQPYQPAGSSGPMIRVAIDGQPRDLINLAGNDYLAIANHPHLVQAAHQAADAYGIGSGASRLVSGHLPIHAEAESRFAAFKQAAHSHAHHVDQHNPKCGKVSANAHGNTTINMKANVKGNAGENMCGGAGGVGWAGDNVGGLLCPTGYMANLAVLTSLAGPGDLVCMDKLNHASLLDAARASGATLRIYPHRDTRKLQRLLHRHPDARRRFIVTDSVFSMDGTIADLPTLADLADEHDAILIIDEAHATGVLGKTGTGLAELQGVAHRIDVSVSTASKALGGLGGIITAPPVVIDTIINHGRSFIYTTGAMPIQAATLIAALDVVRDEPWRRERVNALAHRVRQALADRQKTTHDIDGHQTENMESVGVNMEVSVGGNVGKNVGGNVGGGIVPWVVGGAQQAIDLSRLLVDHGFYAPAIRPPTVAPNAARVRLSLRADLTDTMVDRLISIIKSEA